MASGGAGCPEHLADAILLGGAEAALAASIFHYGEYTIQRDEASHAPPRRAACGSVEFVVEEPFMSMSSLSSVSSSAVRRRRRMATFDPRGRPSAFLGKDKELEIDKLFRALVKLEGSDLHLKVGLPPYVRVAGTLRPLNRGPIDDDEMVRLIFPMFNERTRRIFDEDGGVRLRLLARGRRQDAGGSA